MAEYKHVHVDCPGCKDHFLAPVNVEELAANLKPRETETSYPSFMPGEYCASGNCEIGGVHPNKNYKTKPEKRCKNCMNMAPGRAPRCAWCGEQDNWEEMDDEDLENFGIELPRIMEAHVH